MKFEGVSSFRTNNAALQRVRIKICQLSLFIYQASSNLEWPYPRTPLSIGPTESSPFSPIIHSSCQLD